jgi:hypothetical protein
MTAARGAGAEGSSRSSARATRARSSRGIRTWRWPAGRRDRRHDDRCAQLSCLLASRSRSLRTAARPCCCRRARSCVISNRSHYKPSKIADVSLVEGTIADSNYLVWFGSPGNGIEEADGSIPFSSTKLLRFLKGGLKRFGLESFQGEEANLPPIEHGQHPPLARPAGRRRGHLSHVSIAVTKGRTPNVPRATSI